MPYWMIWAIVGGLGLVAAFIIHALLQRAQGSNILGTLLFGIAGAYLAGWLLPRAIDIQTMTFNEERFFWAVIGGVLFSFAYELASTRSRKGRILIPATGGSYYAK